MHSIVEMDDLLESIGGGIGIAETSGGLSWTYVGRAIWDPPLPPVLSYIPFVCRLVAAMIAIPFAVCLLLDLVAYLIVKILHLNPKDDRLSRSLDRKSGKYPIASSASSGPFPMSSPARTKHDGGDVDGSRSSAIEVRDAELRSRGSSSRRRDGSSTLTNSDQQRGNDIEAISGERIFSSANTTSSSFPSNASDFDTQQSLLTSIDSSISSSDLSLSEANASSRPSPLVSINSTNSSASESTSTSVSSSSSEDEDGAFLGARYPRRTESRLRSRSGDAWKPSESDDGEVGRHQGRRGQDTVNGAHLGTGGPEGMLRDRNESLMFERGSGLCDLGVDGVVGTDANDRSDDEGDKLERVTTLQGRITSIDVPDDKLDDSAVAAEEPLTVLDRSRTPRQGVFQQLDPLGATIPSPRAAAKAENDIDEQGASTSIAVLCSSSTVEQVKQLLRKITLAHEGGEQHDGVWPWKIDNKYYTANVCFRVYETRKGGEAPNKWVDGVRWQDCPALVFVVADQDASTIPEHLANLADAPNSPEVSIALLLSSALTNHEAGQSNVDAQATEYAWDAAGFELLDFRRGSSATGEGAHEVEESDDDAELDPLDRLQEALQTILWPNLVRKPRSRPQNEATSLTAILLDTSTQFPAPPTSFAVDFAKLDRGGVAPSADSIQTDSSEEQGDAWADGSVNVGEEEFAKLDAWLDGDSKPAAPVSNGNVDDAGKHAEPTSSDSFEDDFSDFVTGPPGQLPPSTEHDNTAQPAMPGSPALDALIDPSSLLLHLSNVRDELSGVEDEDERRVRAGKEVEKVLATLGLGGSAGFDEDDGDDDSGMVKER